MNQIVKWIVLILAGLIGVVIILVGILHFVGSGRLVQAPDVPLQMIDIPTDEAAITRGEHLAHAVSECIGCHEPDFSGKVFLNEGPIGRIVATNLTPGKGGIGGSYTDEDWVRAIRHGVAKDGRILGLMPIGYYTHLSDQDLGDLIAYLKTLPPVDNELPAREIQFPGTIILGVLEYGSLPVIRIDHTGPRPATAPSASAIAEYGEYLVIVGACGECHGAKLAGRTDETGPPPGPNLTPRGTLAGWTEADFITAMRNGLTPDERILDPELMPWPGYGNMTDEELKAVWAYLQTLPERRLGANE